ncbi:pyruvate dehydrogenase E1 component alpha subunit [Neobacillus niacini]|uniref:pyruvate dehydrogenase (acetyl-transferring) E1 component subunit alpha n=1 Tax=Neobacillus niacini TaxID=86668 RepID=UPI00277D3D41|nr:pyruvate dehydrogenase (acetyl-transferring) E1 component subunit alpha [Neobacillus niacini]MDQ1002912.1 pyruvate dehydrogenase E1 component alpha subunit [Neobacillus niacini]
MSNTLGMKTDMIQIINENGEVDESRFKELKIDNELLKTMYHWMLKGKVIDKKFLNLQRQGRIGTYGSYRGQEAAQVGSALALEKQDWIVPSYREAVVSMVHGLDLKTFLMYLKGHFGGNRTPQDMNLMPIQVIIAGQIPQAVGIAWASKLKGENRVTACYFGDGATSQGDFHEGLNFASVMKVPAVFFCQNNQWAISVPFEKQMASETIAQKAIAYGMTGIRVDGNDVIACYQVMKEAVERAKRGEGPTLIEAVTYRQGSHTTADDWTKYRKKEEVEVWVNYRDPFIRFEKFLKKRGLLTEQQIEILVTQFEDEIEAEIAAFEKLSPPPAYEVFDHVYDHPHPELLKQKEELKNRIEATRRDHNA